MFTNVVRATSHGGPCTAVQTRIIGGGSQAVYLWKNKKGRTLNVEVNIRPKRFVLLVVV